MKVQFANVSRARSATLVDFHLDRHPEVIGGMLVAGLLGNVAHRRIARFHMDRIDPARIATSGHALNIAAICP